MAIEREFDTTEPQLEDFVLGSLTNTAGVTYPVIHFTIIDSRGKQQRFKFECTNVGFKEVAQCREFLRVLGQFLGHVTELDMKSQFEDDMDVN